VVVFVVVPPLGAAALQSALSRLSYRATATHVFEGNAPVQLIRAEPSSSR